ncbi:MAG: PD40 domain-containing protein [Clostridia bacterium]|nr:PD40 domain-containing protein [Clostridia bacterium]
MEKKYYTKVTALSLLAIALATAAIYFFAPKKAVPGKETPSRLPMPTIYGKMVYQSTENQMSTLYLYDFDNDHITNLSKLTGLENCAEARFSADGGKIVFSADDKASGKRQIYIYDFAANKAECVLPAPDENQCSPAFSPDGENVVFSSTVFDAPMIASTADKYALCTVNLKTGENAKLVTGLLDDPAPAYSEDGASIYYIENSDGAHTFIKKLSLADKSSAVYCSEEGITTNSGALREFDGLLYYARRFNPLSDTVISARYNPATGASRTIAMSSYSSSCFDICPISDSLALVSSDTDGNGLDIVALDIYSGSFWPLGEVNGKINSNAAERICDYFVTDRTVYNMAQSEVKMIVDGQEEKEPAAGESVSFYIDISENSQKYQYSYYCLKDGKIYLSVPRVTTNIIGFTPNEPGNYVLKVYAENGHGERTVSTYEFTVAD